MAEHETGRTALSALRWAAERLREIPDPRLDAEYLLAEALGVSRLEMLLSKQRELTDAERAAYAALVERRAGREPLQYILGTQPFMGFPFRADKRALIPRNDTEALCQAALTALRPGDRALDLCTGSGALAVALKKLCPGASVTASDISADALALAKENAKALGADVRFVRGDLFSPVENERFDLIVSNPPYIPDGFRGRLQAEVEREPALALFAGPDGLDFYRRIICEAPLYLTPRGLLFLETGDGEAEAVAALLRRDFEDIRFKNDLNGLPRVVSARIKEARTHAGSAV